MRTSPAFCLGSHPDAHFVRLHQRFAPMRRRSVEVHQVIRPLGNFGASAFADGSRTLAHFLKYAIIISNNNHFSLHPNSPSSRTCPSSPERPLISLCHPYSLITSSLTSLYLLLAAPELSPRRLAHPNSVPYLHSCCLADKADDPQVTSVNRRSGGRRQAPAFSLPALAQLSASGK